MASSVIKNFVAKALFKKRGAIANNKAVEFSAKDIEKRLINFNINPNDIKSEGELKQVLDFVQKAEDQAFTDRFGNMLQGSRFGKSGDVVDMTGKKLDPNKGIMGGTQTTEETIKENLMKTDNPFSDLVKTTEKGPKTLKEREAEILERMNRENKETVQRIKNRKMIKEAIDNISMGFVKGDKKYNAEILAEEIANKRGLDYFDMDTKQRLDIYDEAFQALTDTDNFATGGRAGYFKGIGPLLRFFSQNSPKQAGQKYLKSVKDRAQKGDVKSLAPELLAVGSGGIFVNRRMKDVLENMNEQDKKIDLENYIKELDADPFFKEYPELKDKMIENYKEVFGETRADGGRAGFANGSAGAPSIKYDFGPDMEPGEVPVFETDKVEDAIREILKRRIRIEGAQIPISEKGQLGVAMPRLDTVGAGGLINLLGGELEVGGMKDFGSGREKLGFEFRKKFGGPKGERVKRKEGGGMSRRQFMKIMGGIASLPFIGKFFKGAKPAAKVAEVATKSTVGQPPEYFFDLAAKIKILGKESSSAPRERMIEVNYKNYSLQEDLVTGDMTIIKRKGDPEFGYEEEVMALKKGQADETTKGKTPPDEYEELTVRPDGDGKMKDIEDGIEPESVKEIMEEVGQGGGNLDQRTLEEIARGKLASGGVAMMLGE